MKQGTNLGSQKGRWIILAALVAVLGALLYLLPGGLAQAQQAQQSFTYAEDSIGPVATFAAEDPEGVSPIVWSLLTDAMGEQNLGIFTDSSPEDNVDDSQDDVVDADVIDHPDFEIDQNGVLTFEPDYENPTDRASGDAAAGDNVYHVVVKASDGGDPTSVNWFKVMVTVTDVEEEGSLAEWEVDADGDGTAQTPDMLLQFQPGTILTVADPMDGDGDVSNIRWQWYRSPSKSAMGTAIDSADATTEEYTVKDTSTNNDVGMYLRVVATYDDRRGPNKTAEFVSINPVQAARADNTVPEFAAVSVTRGITENSEGNIGAPVRATDDDNDILTYSLLAVAFDNDNDDFSIDRITGQLTSEGLDFEDPTDIAGTGVMVGDPPVADTATNNVYVVTLKATDSSGGDSATVTVAITVTDENEKPTFSAGTAGMAPDHREDSLTDDADPASAVDLTVSTYTAADPEGGMVTLSLMGDDMAMFELTGSTAGTRVLAFKMKPDFEMPGDMDNDNIYEVTVRASDGVMYADQMVTIKVTDADEMGMVELSSQDALIGVELTATLMDSDGGVPAPGQFMRQEWMWYSLDASTDGVDATGAVMVGEEAVYTPKVADRGRFLRAMVTYTDRTRDENNNDGDNAAGDSFVGFENTATSDATTAVRNNPDNQAPKFVEGMSTFRLVEENTMALTAVSGADEDDDNLATDNPADNVGGHPVMATDDDGDTPVYTLDGADKDMFRVRANGQIEVSDKAMLDYEAKKIHTVTLMANDGYGGPNSTATIKVTIYVTDLDERPVINDRSDRMAMGQQGVQYAEDETRLVIQLTARDPEGVSPIVWSLLTDAMGEQNLGIFTDSSPEDNVDDSQDDVVDADVIDHPDFEIDQNGVLTFEPDYENPTDRASGDAAAGDNVYHVVVKASDGGDPTSVNWFKVMVTVTDVEEEGSLAEWEVDADGDGTAQTPDMLLQFQPGTILTVADPMDGDGDVSNIRWQWYRSPSKSAMGTAIDSADATTEEYTVKDSPADANDVGMYLRVVATYDDRKGTDKTAEFVSINPVQAARAQDNTVPEFAAVSVTRRITENSEGNIGAPVRATDDDNDILTYSLLAVAFDNDNDDFSIDRITGQLTSEGLDFEDPTDIAGTGVMVGDPPVADTATNNVYVVTLKATDSSGGDSATVTVAITVTDENEKPTFSAGTAGMAPDHREDSLTDDADPASAVDLTVSTYTAADPEGGMVTLSLMGDDMAMFELTGSTAGTRVLAFKMKPDFEMPGDMDNDNIYEVTVRASDGVMYADQMVTIKVTDADEMGMVELSSQDALIGVELTATLMDSDGGVPAPGQFMRQEWMWYSLDASTDGVDATGAVMVGEEAVYTPKVADRGRFLRAMVTYTDRTRDENNNDGDNAAGDSFVGFENTATSDATTAVRNNPDNQAPKFVEGMSTFRLVEENTMALTAVSGADEDDDNLATDNPADNVGGHPVMATDDDDGDTLTYTLDGADKDMFRVRANGQIEVSDKAMLDYEAKKIHTVTLTATDSSGADNNTATITVTIYVTDLDERPVITEGILTLDGPMGRRDYPENGTEPVGTYTMGGPEAAGATMELMGEDVGDLTLEGSGMSRTLKFTSTPNFEMPTDMDEDNEYKVTVMVRKGQITAMVDLTVTVTDVDELGRLAGDASLTYAEDRRDAVGTYTVSGGTMDDTATWTLEGTDAGDFDITGGVLTFSSAPDYESPMGGSNDDSNTYMVTVKASAGGEVAMREVTITVSNVDELGMLAGDASLTYAEDRTDAVGTYTLTGGDGTSTVNWSLGGDDAGDFDITGGVLTFIAGPDYENPMGGANNDSNTYMVTVMAEAGGEMKMMAVAITVNNAEEPGTVTLMPTRPSVGTAITATLEDPDMEMEGTVMWQWASAEAMDGTFTDIDGATMDTYTPVEGDVDMYLRAMASYTDGYGTDSAEMVTDSAVTQLAVNGLGAVEITEHTTSVATYTASGASGSIAWSLTGDDEGAFSISGGALAFSPAPNFEMPTDTGMDNVYMVTVVATADGNMDSRDVTVTVTDVDEDGMVTGLPTSAMVGDVLTAMLDDPDTGVANTTWQWASAGEDGTYADITDATSATYTVADSDAGMSLMATATYDDVHGMNKVVSSEAVMVSAADERPQAVQDYDTNGTAGIQTDELFVAIDDYFDEELSISELLEVIDAYFAS